MMAKPLFSSSDIMTAVEICELLRVSRTKLWKMHKDGNSPPHLELGRGVRRYHRQAVEEWMRKQLSIAR